MDIVSLLSAPTSPLSEHLPTPPPPSTLIPSPDPPTTPKRSEMTRDQRLEARTLHRVGWKYSKIREYFENLGHNISYRQIAYACTTRTTPEKRTGRPPLISTPIRIQETALKAAKKSIEKDKSMSKTAPKEKVFQPGDRDDEEDDGEQERSGDEDKDEQEEEVSAKKKQSAKRSKSGALKHITSKRAKAPSKPAKATNATKKSAPRSGTAKSAANSKGKAAADLPQRVKILLAGQGDFFSHLTFVIGGTPPTLGRATVVALVQLYGGRITTTISGKTDYVVLGNGNVKKKLEKISVFGVETLNEEAFISLVEHSSEQASKAVAAIAEAGEDAIDGTDGQDEVAGADEDEESAEGDEQEDQNHTSDDDDEDRIMPPTKRARINER